MFENKIQFSIEGKSKFQSGEKFAMSAVSNAKGRYAVFSFEKDTYVLINENKVVELNREIRIPAIGRFEAYVEPNLYQSNELLVFLFTKDELTFKPRYSKIEFEHMVKTLDFTRRKLVNHQINIVR